MVDKKLHIPQGINFECTGCGNCCLSWPVPLTREDSERIASFKNGIASATNAHLRAFNSSDPKLKIFTHTLEKRVDGRCEFLTEDNRCQLHLEHSSAMKPSMCQLFPYTFNETPDGIYASVSFASTGALLNSGRALQEQKELLAEKWHLFRELFPTISPDWSQTQIIDGELLSWDDYLAIESEMLDVITQDEPKRIGIEKQLALCSQLIVSKLTYTAELDRQPQMPASPQAVDQILLAHLMELYLPEDVFANGMVDLNTKQLLQELVEPPSVVHLKVQDHIVSFQQLKDKVLGELDPDSENLLHRFVYCRIFAKLYFGAGFAHLSVLTGLHHLTLLIALIRLKIKILAIKDGREALDFLEVAEIVRTLERRLTMLNLTRQSIATFEVLLTSPERISRILSLAD